MDTKGGKPWWGGDGGVLNWAIGIDMYTLMCIKLMTDLKKRRKKFVVFLEFAQCLQIKLWSSQLALYATDGSDYGIRVLKLLCHCDHHYYYHYPYFYQQCLQVSILPVTDLSVTSQQFNFRLLEESTIILISSLSGKRVVFP